MDLLSMIAQGGELLDKGTGGRALRGLASGRPREMASVVPFSDRMGLTDPTQAASGRDVTNKWGLTDPSSHSLGSAAAGFGADLLLNPLNLAGGVGAFSKAPSVGTGLAAAAKSMSGLDAIQGIGKGIGKGAGALADAIKGGGAGRFLADEAGAVSPRAIMKAAKTPVERGDWDKLIGSTDNPLGRMYKLANATPAKMAGTWDENLHPFGGILKPPSEKSVFAHYQPSDPSYLGRASISANPKWGLWRDDNLMTDYQKLIENQGNKQPIVHPDLFGVHESMHAFHYPDVEKFANQQGWNPLNMRDFDKFLGPEDVAHVTSKLGPYAMTSPYEMVAEAGAQHLLSGQPLDPRVQKLYSQFLGPSPEALPKRFASLIDGYRGNSAGFLADEGGTLKIPDKWGPNPIRKDLRNSEWLSPEARSQNPHRMFSTDPAKANYYKRSRQQRQNNPESLAKQIARLSGPTGTGAVGGGLLGYYSNHNRDSVSP